MIAHPRIGGRGKLAALVAGVLTIILIAPPASASVRLGIDIVAPPVLVPVPASPVEYAPSVGANYFFYGGRYFVFADGIWYASATYAGPWDVVEPAFVPGPILAVPIAYYRVVPHEWASWRRDRAPRWDVGFRERPRGFRHEGAGVHAGHRHELEHGRRG